MAGPCLCISLTKGARMVAIVSIVFGVSIAAVSSWILHRSLQARKSPTLATASEFVSQVNTFFGGTTGLYDLDVIFRILISCSAAGLAAGGLQFLMSFWLLLASVNGGRIMARIWVIVHVLIALTVGGSFLCILTNELEMNLQLRIFICSCGADFFFIIYFCFVVYSYSYSDMENNNNYNHSQVYHSPTEQVLVDNKRTNQGVPTKLDVLNWTATKKQSNGNGISNPGTIC